MTNPTTTPVQNEASAKHSEIEWFDQLIHFINSDKFLMSQDMASKDTKAFWESIIYGDTDEFMKGIRQNTNKYFVSKLVVDYMNKVNELGVKPNKLLIDYNNSEVLIWGEVNDDDDRAETDLFRVEGQINAKYYQYGLHVSSTVVEKSDCFIIPPHYKALLPTNNAL